MIKSEKLNVGCGPDVKKGWINLDNANIKGVDVIHDLNILPLPFKDNEFKYIYISHVIEHFEINKILKIMDEFHRILKKGGTLCIRVPYYNNPSAISPMDHKTYFTYNSFNYFEVSNYSKKGETKRWKVMSESATPTLLGKLIPNIIIKKHKKKCFGGRIEMRKITLREFLSYIFGYVISEMEYNLTPIK